MPSTGDASEYIVLNNGVAVTPSPDASEYVVLNNGVAPSMTGNTAEYVMEGDVDGTTPTPVVWAVIPDHGKPGSPIKIYGHGFRTSAFSTNGEVLLDVLGTPVPMPVIDWETVSASPDAYTSGRTINPETADIDPEHGEITFRVPFGVDPGDYTVTVNTDIV